jgi:hypothetical protein
MGLKPDRAKAQGPRSRVLPGAMPCGMPGVGCRQPDPARRGARVLPGGHRMREGRARRFVSVWAPFFTGGSTTVRLAARVACLAILAKTASGESGQLHEESDREGRQVQLRPAVDLACAEPVTKHRRPAVVVMVVEGV